MKYLDYAGLQQYDLLIKQYIQDNIPDSSEAADVATALKNAFNPNSNIKIAICTQAEYNALQTPESNVLYIISDETSEVVNVEANPTLDGTETVLSSIKIGGIKYKMPSIEANPTLDGTETALESIGIGGVKYKIEGGGSSGGEVHLYEHRVCAKGSSGGIRGALFFTYIDNTNTPCTGTKMEELFYGDKENARQCYFKDSSGNEYHAIYTLINLANAYAITGIQKNSSITSTLVWGTANPDIVDTIRQIL